MSKSLKTLSFDRHNKEQNLAFIFLDKIRYNQTRFITKLVMDFIKSSNLDIDDYDEVVRRCKSYIDGNDAVSFKLIDSDNDIKEILAIVRKINSKITPEKSELQTAQIGLSNKEQKSELLNPNTKPQIINEPLKEDGDSFSDMLSSFRMMADK